MATIAERTSDFCRREVGSDSYQMGKYLGYSRGAKEQRDIDIERAWQWMRQHINLIGSEMELHSQFVKAMKDEND